MSTDLYFGNNTTKSMMKMIYSLSGFRKTNASANYYFKTSGDSSYFTGPDTNSSGVYIMTKVHNDDFYCRFVVDLQITKKSTDKGDSGGWINISTNSFYSDDANYEQKLYDIKRSGWKYNTVQTNGRTRIDAYVVPVSINNTKSKWTNPAITDELLIPSWLTYVYVQFATNTNLAASCAIHCMLAE